MLKTLDQSCSQLNVSQSARRVCGVRATGARVLQISWHSCRSAVQAAQCRETPQLEVDVLCERIQLSQDQVERPACDEINRCRNA